MHPIWCNNLPYWQAYLKGDDIELIKRLIQLHIMISRQKREDAKFAALEELMEDQGEEDGDAAGGSPSQQHEPTVDDVEREVCVRNVCDTSC